MNIFSQCIPKKPSANSANTRVTNTQSQPQNIQEGGEDKTLTRRIKNLFVFLKSKLSTKSTNMPTPNNIIFVSPDVTAMQGTPASQRELISEHPPTPQPEIRSAFQTIKNLTAWSENIQVRVSELTRENITTEKINEAFQLVKAIKDEEKPVEFGLTGINSSIDNICDNIINLLSGIASEIALENFEEYHHTLNISCSELHKLLKTNSQELMRPQLNDCRQLINSISRPSKKTDSFIFEKIRPMLDNCFNFGLITPTDYGVLNKLIRECSLIPDDNSESNETSIIIESLNALKNKINEIAQTSSPVESASSRAELN